MDREKLMRKFYKRNKDVTIDDLLLYIKEYMEIRELEERYHEDYKNRKMLSEKIEDRKKNIKLLGEIFEYTLRINSPTPFQDTITDLNLALQTILTLANKEGNQYTIKKFNTTGYSFRENVGGRMERLATTGTVYLIGRVEILYKIDNEKTYFGNELSTVTSEIVNRGNSLIVFTDYHYERSVKPLNNKVHGLDIVNFAVDNTYNKLSCYLFDADDDLKDVVNKFKKYIDKHGADIKDIPLEELREFVLNVDKEEEKEIQIVKKIGRPRKKQPELKNYDGVVFYYE